MSQAAELDHLVIGARTLDEGAAWCEATLGVTPGPGGKHGLMSTHNRLLSVATPEFPRAYLEIIATDPEAQDPGRVRWFDLDEGRVQQQLSQGPQLLHWVMRVRDIKSAHGQWRALGLDAGELLQASRLTPHGELRWQIAVRSDGRRLLQGALPLLIEWGEVHPADTMPISGVQLRSLGVGSLDAEFARRALAHLGLQGLGGHSGAASFAAQLDTPKGLVSLQSLS